MIKIYISGGITGLSVEQFAKSFNEAAKYLTSKGFDVINPLELDHKNDSKWIDYMLTDLMALKDCTHIFMLRRWAFSRGAIIEHEFAKEMGLTIIYQQHEELNEIS